MSLPEDSTQIKNLGSNAFNRRRLVGTGAVLSAGLVATTLAGKGVFAQDATPSADGATPAPQSNESSGAQFPKATKLGNAIPSEYTADESNWPSEGQNLKATRYVTKSTISSTTIDKLGVAWNVPISIGAPYGSLVANPVIANGILFQQDAQSNVYALNKETGEKVWTNIYNDAVPSGGPNGVGLGYDMAFFTLGGSAIVVAAKQDTGEEVWRTNIKGYRHEGITMAPLVFDSTVYVSTIPGTPEAFYNGGQRGFIFALDASTGGILWYFDTTTDNLWTNARINSGGGLWHVPSVDDEGQLYFGIGNAAPYPGVEGFPAATSRMGDNNYADSLLKINPETAALEWFINVKPHDLFDLDNQLTPILASVSIGGKDINVVFASGKHGIVVAADSDTGKELWRTPVGKHQNDNLQELPADGSTVEVFPGTLGGVETAMAFAEGIVFAPIVNVATAYGATALDPTSLDFSKGTGQLVALEAATGKILWDVELPTSAYAGATVVNDVVFTGGLDGIIRAFKVDDGKALWTWQAPAGVNAPLAASGDYLYVPAGGPFYVNAESKDPEAKPIANLVALKIGGTATVSGSSATPAAEASPATSTSGDSAVNTFDVSTVDIAFDPKELTIPAGTDVTIKVTNKGLLQHDFSMDDPKAASKLLNGGESDSVTINLKSGEYQYYCSVPGHKEAGMVGKLIVK